jgi:hypothetical protein
VASLIADFWFVISSDHLLCSQTRFFSVPLSFFGNVLEWKDFKMFSHFDCQAYIFDHDSSLKLRAIFDVIMLLSLFELHISLWNPLCLHSAPTLALNLSFKKVLCYTEKVDLVKIIMKDQLLMCWLSFTILVQKNGI